MKIKIGQGSSTHIGLKLYTYDNIILGALCVIDGDCTLDSRGRLTIGNNVNTSPEVMTLTAYHNPDAEEFTGIEKSVMIEDYAWIATRAMILPGVTIGHGAIVAAGAVVTNNVAPRTIVGGNPDRVIRIRKGDQTYTLDYRRFLH